jgi:superfamily II DNA/RNA helicase
VLAESFAAAGVSDEFVERLSRMFGVTQPSEVQRRALPLLLLERRQAVVKAETGSGKTITYLLPLLQDIHQRLVGPLTFSAAPGHAFQHAAEGPKPPAVSGLDAASLSGRGLRVQGQVLRPDGVKVVTVDSALLGKGSSSRGGKGSGGAAADEEEWGELVDVAGPAASAAGRPDGVIGAADSDDDEWIDSDEERRLMEEDGDGEFTSDEKDEDDELDGEGDDEDEGEDVSLDATAAGVAAAGNHAQPLRRAKRRRNRSGNRVKDGPTLEDPTGFASAVVVVPTQELVHQVLQVAHALLPECADLMRGVYGEHGISRKQRCALIVGTPAAIAANVNARHLDRLRFLVLDEVDMLLSASYLPVVKGAFLSKYKHRMPEDRPRHIFVGATIPNRGQQSAEAFLDQFYPEPEFVRIETPRAHRQLKAIKQRFIQLDAAWGLTQAEEQARETLKRRLEKAAQDAVLSKEERLQRKREKKRAAAAAAGKDLDDDAEYFDAEDGEDDDAAAAIPAFDAVAERMDARKVEDRILELKRESEEYKARLDNARKYAVLQALADGANMLNGAHISIGHGGSESAAAAAPSEADEAGEAEDSAAPPISGASSRRRRQREEAPSMLELTSVSDASLDAVTRRKKKVRSLQEIHRAAAVQALPAPPKLGDFSSPAPTSMSSEPWSASQQAAIVPFVFADSIRPKLRADEIAAIPQTIVFVGTWEAADNMKKFLATTCPTLRVSCLHKKLPDDVRAAHLARFQAGEVQVMVCTDVASRGLDTTKVAHVIQADFASDVVSHMHRVGRTGRAGRDGLVTNLVCRSNLDLANMILKAAASGESIETAFSRKRSLRRRIVRSAIAAKEDEAVLEVLEAEQKEIDRQEAEKATKLAAAEKKKAKAKKITEVSGETAEPKAKAAAKKTLSKEPVKKSAGRAKTATPLQ